MATSSTTHDGIVDDNRVYSTLALARIFGVKQTRTIEKWLEQVGCPVTPLGSRVFVSGYLFRLAIERNSIPRSPSSAVQDQEGYSAAECLT